VLRFTDTASGIAADDPKRIVRYLLPGGQTYSRRPKHPYSCCRIVKSLVPWHAGRLTRAAGSDQDPQP